MIFEHLEREERSRGLLRQIVDFPRTQLSLQLDQVILRHGLAGKDGCPLGFLFHCLSLGAVCLGQRFPHCRKGDGAPSSLACGVGKVMVA